MYACMYPYKGTYVPSMQYDIEYYNIQHLLWSQLFKVILLLSFKTSESRLCDKKDYFPGTVNNGRLTDRL